MSSCAGLASPTPSHYRTLNRQLCATKAIYIKATSQFAGTPAVPRPSFRRFHVAPARRYDEYAAAPDGGSYELEHGVDTLPLIVSSKFRNSSALYGMLSLDSELSNPGESTGGALLSGDIISNDCNDGPAMLQKSKLE